MAQLSWQRGLSFCAKHSLPQWARCRCWLCHLFQLLCSTSQKIVPTALGRKRASDELFACFHWRKDIRCFKDTLAEIRDVSFPPLVTIKRALFYGSWRDTATGSKPWHCVPSLLHIPCLPAVPQPVPCSRGALSQRLPRLCCHRDRFKVGRPLLEKSIE